MGAVSAVRPVLVTLPALGSPPVAFCPEPHSTSCPRVECLRRPSLWNHVVVSTKLLLAAFLAIAGARLIFDSTRLTRFSVVGGTIALIGLGSTLCLTTIHRGMETALALMLLVFAVDPLILNKHLSRSRGITLGGRPQAALLVTILFVAGTCAGLPSRCAKPTTDDEYVLQAAREVTTTRGIYDLRRCLPKLHQVYHSEIGVPGLIFPTARVVDLGGLMSKEVMLDRLPFD